MLAHEIRRSTAHKARLHQGTRHQVRIGHLANADQHIDAFLHHIHHAVAGRGAQRNLRILRQKARQGRRDVQARDQPRHVDAQRAAGRVSRIVHARFELGHICQQAQSLFIARTALAGE